MTTRLPVVVDGATGRLIALARGVQVSGQLPKSSGTTLVQLARSVRLFAEAFENALAATILDDIEALAKDAYSEAPLVSERLTHHVTVTRKALR